MNTHNAWTLRAALSALAVVLFLSIGTFVLGQYEDFPLPPPPPPLPGPPTMSGGALPVPASPPPARPITPPREVAPMPVVSRPQDGMGVLSPETIARMRVAQEGVIQRVTPVSLEERRALLVERVVQSRELQQSSHGVQEEKLIRARESVFAVYSNRLSAGLQRLEKITERIASRTQGIEMRTGVDLAPVREVLDTAHIGIINAGEDVAYFQLLLQEVIKDTRAGERIAEVREALQISRDSLVYVHTLLQEAVAMLASFEQGQ